MLVRKSGGACLMRRAFSSLVLFSFLTRNRWIRSKALPKMSALPTAREKLKLNNKYYIFSLKFFHISGKNKKLTAKTSRNNGWS